MDGREAFAQTVPAECFSAAGVAQPPPAPADHDGLPRLAGAALTGRLRRGQEDGGAEGRYRVDSLLGVGATGQVFAVFDRNLRRPVAVKVLNRELVGRDDLDGFVDEARITASLAHPNVLPVHEIDLSEDGRPYFTMGRIDGRPLGEVLAPAAPGAPRPERIASFNAVVSVMIAVCNAVAYAHHRGVIHQDIKPDNIMLGEFGEVLLLDWGSAGEIGDDGRLRSRLYGTPLYMSPEQARQEFADRRSDVYCLGATLFHALTLRVPTWSDDAERFWRMKRAGELCPPTEAERGAVPAELLGIALKALEADPAARYDDTDAMRRDLERYQAGLAVSAHRESAWRRFRRWHRRNGRPFWISAVAAIAVAAMLAALVTERRKELSDWHKVYDMDGADVSAERLSRDWIGRVNTEMSAPFADTPLAGSEFFAVHDGAIELIRDQPPERYDGRNPVVDLAWQRPFRGDLRVEWDCRSEVAGKNFNCFIGAADRQSGFTFHIGGYNDPGLLVLTKGKDFIELAHRRLLRPLEKGRVVHLAMEREDRHLRLWIDGECLIDYVDPEEGGAGRFGFDSFFGNRLLISHARVFNHPLAQRISPIEVGDRFFQRGLWREAAIEYGEVRDSYAGTDLAAQAEYQIALCATHDPACSTEPAEKLLGDFEKRWPGHRLVPFAMYERLNLVRGSPGRRDEAEAIRDRFAAFRGDPLLRTVLLDLGNDLSPELARRPTRSFGDSFYPEEVVEAAHRGLERFDRLCAAYGMPNEHYPYMSALAVVLSRAGEHELILSHPGFEHDEKRYALDRMGRFAEILADGEQGGRGGILNSSGRSADVLADPRSTSNERAWAQFNLGRLDLLEQQNDPYVLREALLRQGRAADVLVQMSPPLPSDVSGPGLSQRVRALLCLGRYQEVLDTYTSTGSKIRALVGLGRAREALQAHMGGDVSGAALAILGMRIAGDREGCSAGLEHMARLRPDYEDDAIFPRYIMPGMLGALDGDAQAFARWTELLSTRKETHQQWPWHLVSFVRGEIGEAEFRAQPVRVGIEGRLLMARALRAELGGDHGGALDCYRKLVALPFWQRQYQEVEEAYVAWRIAALGAAP
jgi:serine/threonine protein kinase